MSERVDFLVVEAIPWVLLPLLPWVLSWVGCAERFRNVEKAPVVLRA